MTGFPDWHDFNAAMLDIEAWFRDNVLALNNLFQLVAIALAFAIAAYGAPRLHRGIVWLLRRPGLPPRLRIIGETLALLSLPFTWLVLQWLSLEIADGLGWPHALVKITVSLLAAWIVIRVATGLVRDPAWSKAIAIVIWTIAALNIVNLLDPTVALLDSIAIRFGAFRISALTVIKGMLSLAGLAAKRPKSSTTPAPTRRCCFWPRPSSNCISPPPPSWPAPNCRANRARRPSWSESTTTVMLRGGR